MVDVIRAREEDAELVRHALLVMNGRAHVSDAALATFLGDPCCYVLLALDARKPVGSLIGYLLPQPHRTEPQFLLYEVDVHEQWRKQGIGKALVDAFTACAQAAGAHEVWVLSNESNRPAMTMYRSCGYVRPNRDDVMLKTDIDSDSQLHFVLPRRAGRVV